ncbi:MAG TPA: hypothetical protein VNE63_08900 [Candidatus Acidoferrales bacterium]|nr:hypothetical protein [Candidatus Acidoferrales bacterium]
MDSVNRAFSVEQGQQNNADSHAQQDMNVSMQHQGGRYTKQPKAQKNDGNRPHHLCSFALLIAARI